MIPKDGKNPQSTYKHKNSPHQYTHKYLVYFLVFFLRMYLHNRISAHIIRDHSTGGVSTPQCRWVRDLANWQLGKSANFFLNIYIFPFLSLFCLGFYFTHSESLNFLQQLVLVHLRKNSGLVLWDLGQGSGRKG